jgi:predicted metal-dependent hydrolase
LALTMAMGGLLRLFERERETAHLDLRHNGEVFRIAINRSTRSRRFTLRVRTASRDVLLTMPARAPMSAAREFAERHAAWIGARLARLPRPIAFEPLAKTPLRGVDHTIVHKPGARGVVWTEAAEHGPLLCVAGERPHVARRVHDFLRREAMKDIEAAVARHAKAIGVQPKRIAVRDTVSRWGSCSSSGRLSFSWRLILAPPYVLDYLAAHEVAHLVHLNHSARYWALVGRVSPDVKRAEAWLKAHGASLHRFGAE